MRMDDKVLENILLSVQSPARYIGNELNTPMIDKNARVKFCLMSPNLYEDGMGDMRLLTLYHKVNDRKGMLAERVFAPWLDMASALKKNNRKLFSLESRTDLCNFDLLGAHLKYQTEFTALLFMLDLGGVSVQTSERKESDPLVFGYGDGVINPSVVSSFLDFCIIGDAEDVILDVIDTIKSAKTNRFSRKQTLEELDKLRGVCVPSLVKKHVNKKGELVGFDSLVTKKAVSFNLDRVYYPSVIQIPNIQVKRECVKIEPIRGCTRGCRFCQYGFTSRPLRERRVSVLSSTAMTGITSTGYSAIKLDSKCALEYSKIGALESELNKLQEQKNSVVLSSIFDENHEYSDFVVQETKNVLGFYIEAGSESLRKRLNVDLSNQRILDAVKAASRQGYSNFKLHFILGLPFETGDDLNQIVSLVKSIKDCYKQNKTCSKPAYVTINLAGFIPKPFTPFGWCEGKSKEELQKRFLYIKKAAKNLKVRVQTSLPELCEIETILSRGDERISDAVINAYKHGAIFDRNKKLFSYAPYKKAFDELGIDVKSELAARNPESVAVWDCVDVLVTKEYLLREFKKAKDGKTTGNCKGNCQNCGLNKSGVCKNGRL